jgi:curli biogenesis system outer membrane secretion channel CsgG
MKPDFLLIFLSCAVLSCASGPTTSHPDNEAGLLPELLPYSGEKMIVAVLDLQNQSEFEDPRIGRGVAKMLITALVNSNRFIVVERNEEALQKLLQEQSLGLSGLVDAATAARVGKLLGAKGIIIGEISEFGIRKTSAFIGLGGSKSITTRVVIDARMVDVESSQIIMAASGVGQSETSTSGIALTFEFGTQGFDETCIGISTRKAVNSIASKFSVAFKNNKTN